MTEKRCTKCEEVKDASEFSPAKKSSDGRFSYCKECNSARTLAWMRQTPDKHNVPAYKRHHLSDDQYLDMLSTYDGGCWICRRVPEPNEARLSVDHDHACCDKSYSCGKCVRGLLCGKCNRVLGLIDDNVNYAKNLVEYIEHYVLKE